MYPVLPPSISAALSPYAYAVKERLLGVPHALLEAQGAVCEPVARRMAEGARSLLGADYAPVRYRKRRTGCG